jgi:hypothetical protein
MIFPFEIQNLLKLVSKLVNKIKINMIFLRITNVSRYKKQICKNFVAYFKK